MRFLTVAGVTLHYTLEGEGDGLPLVFINSLGTDLRIWDDVLPQLPAQHPVVRHDKRGHGLSDCPPGPYRIGDHSEDVARLLAHLGIEEAIVIGISVGGVIALDFAIAHPDVVRGLILCDTAPRIGTMDFWEQRVRMIREKGLPQMAESILERWFAPQFAEEQPAAYRGYQNMLARMPDEGYAATSLALGEADLRDAVHTIEAPALVLCGAEDQATPPDVGRELAESLPNARFEVIEGAAHLPCIERPQATAEKINQFLKENGYG
ncbi:MAG: 3-oxoadipate enol-lactonase [bacterium]